MPTWNPGPRVRRSSSPMYSMRGLSKTSFVLSGKTPSWLLFAFCPVAYADIPGEESVMRELSDEVITRPVTSSVSIARCPAAFPLTTPRETIRAAVRWAAPIPSPSSRMMFLARAVPARPVQASTRRCAEAWPPSTVRASMTNGPGCATL
jgi:hypothetical protein